MACTYVSKNKNNSITFSELENHYLKYGYNANEAEIKAVNVWSKLESANTPQEVERLYKSTITRTKHKDHFEPTLDKNVVSKDNIKLTFRGKKYNYNVSVKGAVDTREFNIYNNIQNSFKGKLYNDLVSTMFQAGNIDIVMFDNSDLLADGVKVSGM